MLILGGLLLHIFVTALLFRPHPKTVVIDIGKVEDKNDSQGEESQEQYDEPDILNMNMQVQNTTQSKILNNEKPSAWPSKLKVYIQILTDPVFVAFAISVMCIIFMLSCSAFLAGLAEERDISITLTAIILVVTSVGTCLGQILFGILFDINFFKKRRMILFCCISAVSGVICCLLPFARGFPSLLVLNLVTNILSHGMHGQHVTILSDITGRRRVVSAIGICRLIMGLGYLAGPVVGGKYFQFNSGTVFC